MILVRITMNPLLDKQLEVMQTLESMIEPTSMDKGCLSCTVFCGIEDRNHFCLIEEWETREDLDHHMATQRFGALLGIKALLSDPFEIQIQTVSQSEGVEAVYAVRKKEAEILPIDEERSPIK